MQLSDRLAEKVAAWRAKSYAHADFPATAEILEWLSGRETERPRFLRIPQVRVLETYWYLRLAEGTASIPELYAKFAANPRDCHQQPIDLEWAVHLEFCDPLL